MGCCGAATRIHTARINGKVLAPPGGDEFDGPLHNRSCRDVVFLILFIAFIIGAIIFLAYVGTKSDPKRLIHGADRFGNVCGRKNEQLFNLSESGKDYTDYPFFSVGATFDASGVIAHGQPQLDGTCVKKCDQNTTTTLAFYCIPVQTKEISNTTDTVFKNVFGQSLTGFFEQITKDINATWPQILILAIIALALAILITVLLRFIAFIVVIAFIIVLVILSIGGTIFLWVIWSQQRNMVNEIKSNDARTQSDYEIQVMEQKVKYFMIGAIVATIFTVVIIVLLIAMRKRIMLVIELFKEAGKAVGAMPLIVLQPIWTCLWLAIVVLLWLVGWILIEAAGDPKQYQDTVVFVKDTLIKNMRFYHLFVILWVTQFVIACQYVTIAGAVAQWYFTRNKKELGWPILTSMKRMYRYHLGSIALGSLIIALVKMLRYMMKWAEGRARRSGNQCCVWFLKCCQCCLWCFEKFLKFLNKNAYIEIAIYGYGFCKAAQKAFTMLVSNALRVVAISSIGTFVLFLAKLAIVSVTIVIGYFMLKSRDDISSTVFPLIISGFIALFIAHCFISVYEMTIDTIFLCFCEDCERNDGINKPYYMSRGLMKYVENSKKALDALDDQEHQQKNIREGASMVQPVGAKAPPSVISTPVHGGMTPLHPAYPPISMPPSPTHLMPPQ